jgi:hypothetical protein
MEKRIEGGDDVLGVSEENLAMDLPKNWMEELHEPHIGSVI